MAGSPGSIYTGDSVLRISIDFGAANSAVTYHKLLKNQPIPTPQSIQTYPKAPNPADSKVPSVILYRECNPIAFGFEAEKHFNANDDGYLLVKHFKLALHPDYMIKSAEKAVPDSDEPLAVVKYGELFEKPILPKGLRPRQVITHYLRWLYGHTRDSFIKYHGGGQDLWDKMIDGAEFIMGAPNGWSPQQRQTLKDALMGTGLCRDPDKVTIISEGEASLHHVLNLQSRPLTLQDDTIFLVCDAGGSTVDTTAYKCIDAKTVTVEEVGASDCLQRGGIYLSRHMRLSVEEAFGRLPAYNTPENVYAAMRSFEHDIKNQYTINNEERQFLNFTHSKTPASDKKYFILNGNIGIEGNKFKAAFEFSASAIIARLTAKIEEAEADGQVKSIILVGGLGDSPYLHKRLEAEFGEMDISIIRAPYDMPGAKAVSIGASWYALNSQTVVRRAAAFHYGYVACEHYDENDRRHRGRDTHMHEDGEDLLVANQFGSAIEKGTLSSPGEFFWHGLVKDSRLPVDTLSARLYASTSEEMPYWVSDSNQCAFRQYNDDILELGTVLYNGSGIPSKRRKGPHGDYYTTEYQLGVSFGGAEIVCQMRDADTKTLIGPQFTFSAVPA